jgi:hypothetical protein
MDSSARNVGTALGHGSINALQQFIQSEQICSGSIFPRQD